MVAGLNISYKIAIIVGYIITTNVSILTMRYYVFRSHGKWWQEYTKAWSVYLTTMLMNYVAMYVMVDMCSVNELLAQAVYMVVIVIFTYLMHQNFSFSHR